MRNLTLNITNEALSALQKKLYEKTRTAVPNKVFGARYPEFLKDLGRIYEALSGNPLDPESNTFMVKANQDGCFQKIYGPSVYASSAAEGLLVIRWGTELIEIGAKEVKGGKKVTYELFPSNTQVDATDLTLTFAKVAFSATSFDPVLRVSLYLEDEEDTLTVEFPVWCIDNTNKPSDDKLNEKVLRKPQALRELISVIKEGSNLPTLSFRKEADEEDGTSLGEYVVTGYRMVNTQHGTSAVLTIDASSNDDYNLDAFEAWAPTKDISNMLMSSPVITKEAPATLIVSDRKNVVTKAGRNFLKITSSLMLNTAANAVDEDDDFLSGW